MTTLREAAQQALDYWEQVAWGDAVMVDKMDTLRAALAQQAESVQEPVAWMQPRTLDGYLRPDLGYETCSKSDYGAFPVYTAPPQRKPLSEVEIAELAWQEQFLLICDGLEELTEITRAVERAHGIGDSK